MEYNPLFSWSVLLPFLLPLISVMFILFIFVNNSMREQMRACARLAQRLGLGFRPIGWLGAGEMRGERGGWSTRVEVWNESSSEGHITYARPAMRLGLSWMPKFQIVRRSPRDQAHNMRREDDIETGDEAFDRQFSVRGA
ncbi:MAG: hypothetical protein AAFS10_11285, partial [Myxococcota bacterium]